jgi:excisionase family DNA binding protein
VRRNIVEIEIMPVKPEIAGQMLQFSRATIYRMIAAGEIETVRLPGRRDLRIPVDAIRRLLEPAK